jgi:LuxR family maltose regulon positive regulatory protein
MLNTKLNIPPLRRDGVPRPRLVARLDAGLEMGHRLALVSAPAGYGKTTLLSEWVATLTGPVAWLTLDADDSNIIRFWAYLIAALRAARVGHRDTEAQSGSLRRIGQHALEMLESSGTTAAHAVATSLLNDLASLVERVVLVLDDYHTISDGAIHDEVAFMLEHQPPQMHLVLATRADPPLPLSRLRARGQLTELRAADLRFTPAEAATFLNRTMGLGLTAEAVSALAGRCEGWIAGLQLAALSIQGRSDHQEFIQAFAGSHHYILEYLTDEVLQRQPESLRRFLAETSILHRLCAPLCDQLTGRDDSADVLAELDRRNLFITALDGERRWFRYHPLFADLLAAHRQRLGASDVRDLHRRAADWYGKNGFASEAIQHALDAQDYRLASRLIVDNWRRLFHQGWLNTAAHWLESLPPAMVREIAPLGIAHCWTLFVRGEFTRIPAHLEDVTRAFDQAVAGGELPAIHPEYRIVWHQVQLLQAVVARLRQDIAAANDHVAQALAAIGAVREALGPAFADLASGACHFQMGHNHLAAGELEQAADCFSRSAPHSRAAGNLFATASAVSEFARIRMRQGRLAEAEAACREALALAGQPEYAGWPAFCLVQMALAEVLCESGRLDEAWDCLQPGLETGRRSGHVLHLAYGHLTAARLQHRSGNATAAHAALQAAQALAATIENPSLREAVAVVARELTLPSPQPKTEPLVEPLTERERQVLRLICEGRSNQEIAADLVVALDTVKRHVSNIYGKLGVQRRTQAVRKARELGLG